MASMTDNKACSRCGDRKPLADFPVDKRARTGRASWCKSCGNVYRQKYRKRPDISRLRLLVKPGEKVCVGCMSIKPIEEFSPGGSSAVNRTTYCRACGRARRQRVKLDVIRAYGGACACCGVTELVFLAIDHLDGDGARHRRSIGRQYATSSWYRWLQKQNYPSGYQVLCHNCNFAKHWGGCPHQNQ